MLDKLREKLKSRGARGIIGLGRNFRITDKDKSMKLDRYEFSQAMSDYALGFSEKELDQLFNYFDYNRDNEVDYDEFIRTIRGPMNNVRKQVVRKCFDVLDKDGSGFVELKDLQGVYNAS